MHTQHRLNIIRVESVLEIQFDSSERGEWVSECFVNEWTCNQTELLWDKTTHSVSLEILGIANRDVSDYEVRSLVSGHIRAGGIALVDDSTKAAEQLLNGEVYSWTTYSINASRVSLCILVIIFIIYVLVWKLLQRKSRRIFPTRCPACGYSREGLTLGRICPECGTDVNRKGRVASRF